MRIFQRNELKLDEDLIIFRISSKRVCLSYGEVHGNLTAPFLRYYILKLGGNVWALMAALKNGAQTIFKIGLCNH